MVANISPALQFRRLVLTPLVEKQIPDTAQARGISEEAVVRDVLLEAGFDEVETFWEGTAEDGESGNGIYRRSRRGENCEAWVTYLVAYK